MKHTAQEVRERAKRMDDIDHVNAASMLHAYADLLEQMESAEPVAWEVRVYGPDWEPTRDPEFHQSVGRDVRPLYAHPPAASAKFQPRVEAWMAECFSPGVCHSMTERGDRLMEEVLELLQSNGYGRERIATLVEYVYGRPVGEPAQEVGGVMVTLAAYCWVAGLNMHEAGETELTRITQPDIIAKIRAKQEAKRALHFDTPLPGNAAQPNGEPVNGCELGCANACKAEAHGVPSECPDLSKRPPAEIADESIWREGWAIAYSGRHLYGDDGELQDNRQPMIDWRRDSALEIRQKIHARGMQALANPEPASAEPVTQDARINALFRKIGFDGLEALPDWPGTYDRATCAVEEMITNGNLLAAFDEYVGFTPPAECAELAEDYQWLVETTRPAIQAFLDMVNVMQRVQCLPIPAILETAQHNCSLILKKIDTARAQEGK